MEKRKSENGQIRKEDMEALNNRDDSIAALAPFERASDDQMNKRVIIRVSRSATKPHRAANKSRNSNPFATTILKTEPNVFVPKTSFIPTAMQSNKEGGHLSTKEAPFSMKVVEKKDIKLNKAQKLNITVLGFTQFAWDNINKLDWSCWQENYMNEMEALQKGNVVDDESMNDEYQSEYKKNVDKKDVKSEEQSGDKLFSGQNSSAPAPTSTPSNITFGMAPNASAAAAPAAPKAPAPKFTGFSFGAAGSTPALSNPLAIPKSKEEENTESQDEPTKFLPATNDDEENLHLVRAKYRKYIKEEKTWKSFSAGALGLYRHKTKQSCRMTLRNEYGSVLLNLGVCQGMKFKKVVGKKIGSVQFVGIQDSDIGPETFMLVVKPNELDKLHETLEEMAK